jgi:uncharacterized protein YndB with AHSA1/START domain
LGGADLRQIHAPVLGARTIEPDWKAGSPVIMTKKDGSRDWSGEVLESDPPRRLSDTFDVPPHPDRATVVGARERNGLEKHHRWVRFGLDRRTPYPVQ